jgi:NADPH:quinone reductase-like Zn-dependent oxidoreductase
MAGIVEATGRAATRFRVGDAVFGETAALSWRNGGAFAEYVAVPESWLARKPDHVPFEHAASVPTSGYILFLNLRDASELRPGRRVLVNGGGGGVGSLTIQLAKSRGAHVTAVDSAAKQDLLRALGADEVIDYARSDFVHLGVRYHLIVDVPGTRPFSEVRQALEPDGRYVPIGHEDYGRSGKRTLGLLPHFLRLMFLSRWVSQLRGPRVPPPSRTEVMETLRSLLASGALTPLIDRAYPLEEVRAAFRHMMEDALQGKVMLTP